MIIEEVVSVLPPQVANNIGVLIRIFQAVGIAVVVYTVYLIITGFFMFRRIKRMRHIEKKVDVIDKKLDRLLKEFKKNKK